MLNGVMHDITERRQAETALKESDEKFRAICASAVDAILMMDNDGSISFWNCGAERVFGHTSGFATGKYLHELLVPERYREPFSKGFAKFRETGEGAVVGKTLEVSALRKDGSEFPVELSVSSVKLEGQWGAMGIIKDITGRKKAQERNEGQLKQLAALRAIAMDNNAMFENLQRSNTDLVLAYDATIEGWSRALDLRDKETEGHSRRVPEMSLRLARAMGVSREDLYGPGRISKDVLSRRMAGLRKSG